MTTKAENLQQALDELVASKTLTLEAVDYVNRIKANAADVARENAEVKLANNALQGENSKVRAENDRLNSKVSEIDAREKALTAREAKCRELEMACARADATAATMRECFGLVFRNFTVNRNVMDSVVTPNNVPGNYPHTTPINKSSTETVA